MSLLELDGVRRFYKQKHTLLSRASHAPIRAVDGVDFVVEEGETVGLVGESGCGKSTLARIICGLEDPSEGNVRWNGADVGGMSRSDRKTLLHREVQMVFQDPHASLDPRRSVGQSIAEGITTHALLPASKVEARVGELLVQVGLNPDHAHRYPHEFSGGQLQRIGIARALAVEPRLLVCDEPVSALDISVRAQVLNLLNRLKRELGLSIIFIAHDLDVVQHMSDRIVTMYLGKVVEEGDCDDVYGATAHPYTRALLSAIPRKLAPNERLERVVLDGDPPSPIDPPAGCPFHTRCYTAVEKCATETPPLVAVPGGALVHRSACHLSEQITLSRIGMVSTIHSSSTPSERNDS